MVLLIAGSFATGRLRTVLWVLAAAIDYAGPAWLTRERLRGLQHVAVAHFAERYSLFVIICLGESIVAIGVGALGTSAERASDRRARRRRSALGAADHGRRCGGRTSRGLPSRAEERLREHDDPVLAAADGYSYLHLVIVAGIITFAVGVKVLTRDSVSAPLPDPARLALCGGVALYLVGHAALRAADDRRGRAREARGGGRRCSCSTPSAAASPRGRWRSRSAVAGRRAVRGRVRVGAPGCQPGAAGKHQPPPDERMSR